MEFHLNENVFESFKNMYNADILIGGHSCFPKIIALFSRNVFFYLPFNDGVTRVLGGGVTGGPKYWGRSFEETDTNRCIMTDIYCEYNRSEMIRSLVNLSKATLFRNAYTSIE